MSFISSLQSWPLHIRKLIFWLIIIIVALAMGFWWFQLTQERLPKLKSGEVQESIQLPKFDFPDMELPATSTK